MAGEHRDADPGSMAGGLLIRPKKEGNGFKAPAPRTSLLGNASGEADMRPRRKYYSRLQEHN